MSADRCKLLVVEDKENMLTLLEQILTPHHDVTAAADGTAALAAIERTEFDLVLTDVRMPGPDGFEVVRRVKQRWPDTEVVVMTAFASIPAAVAAVREGAYDYIQKPFDPDDVSLVVARALERRRDRRAKAAGKPDITSLSYREAMNVAQEQSSREYLTALLRAFAGNVSRAAERAGMERESLHRLLRRYGVRADEFRNEDPGSGSLS